MFDLLMARLLIQGCLFLFDNGHLKDRPESRERSHQHSCPGTYISLVACSEDNLVHLDTMLSQQCSIRHFALERNIPVLGVRVCFFPGYGYALCDLGRILHTDLSLERPNAAERPHN